jgi:hypothetical protein
MGGIVEPAVHPFGLWPGGNLTEGDMRDYQVNYPADFDDDEWSVIKTKGWLEVRLAWTGGERKVTFYDRAGLAQEIDEAIGRSGYFTEGVLVIVSSVTRGQVETAVRHLAERDFLDLG